MNMYRDNDLAMRIENTMKKKKKKIKYMDADERANYAADKLKGEPKKAVKAIRNRRKMLEQY